MSEVARRTQYISSNAGSARNARNSEEARMLLTDWTTLVASTDGVSTWMDYK